jgi:hypothetical protein
MTDGKVLLSTEQPVVWVKLGKNTRLAEGNSQNPAWGW